MGADSKIEWTHATFNPWIGCTKVSPGCANCYAEAQAKFRGWAKWGPGGKRKIKAESGWGEPLKWECQASESGERLRVFCALLADVFEDRPELDAPRERLFDLILATPHLDWLLLTKRPNAMADYLCGDTMLGSRIPHAWGDGWPNVWLGTSVEDQERVKERIPVLLSIPGIVHWLSMEPLLGPVALRDYLYFLRDARSKPWPGGGRVSWVVVGGESGPHARPMHPSWVRSIQNECDAARAAFFFKQWGEYGPDQIGPVRHMSVHSLIPMDEPAAMFKVGKKAAGRMLDGREWSEFPRAHTKRDAKLEADRDLT